MQELLSDGFFLRKVYERRFNALIKERVVEDEIAKDTLENACLLCSEALADKCHRRLVAEYFQTKYPAFEIVHL